MKYMVLYWVPEGYAEEDNTWAVYWYGTNRREARTQFNRARSDVNSPIVRLVEVTAIAEDHADGM